LGPPHMLEAVGSPAQIIEHLPSVTVTEPVLKVLPQ
jgi:hypothetical protein